MFKCVLVSVATKQKVSAVGAGEMTILYYLFIFFQNCEIARMELDK